MSVRLGSITLRGFRSIRKLEGFAPGPVNVLIGANGAGKSNFISFFRLLSFMTNGEFQNHVAALGGANALLHDGAGTTPQIDTEITLTTGRGENDYTFRAFHAANDTLVFAEEQYRFSDPRFATKAPWNQLGAGHRETGLTDRAELGDKTAGAILGLLRKCVVYQFHNTSTTARVRQKWFKDDSRWLKEDGANLGAFLLRLQGEEPEYYHRIRTATRAVLPFFVDYLLEPDKADKVLLRWRETETDEVFSVSQASDGMLRTMALIALLGQPERDLPGVLILDEPELGLHPHAISVVSGMLRSASFHAQVIVATQSTSFVDQFQPEEVVVVNRTGRESTFERLDGQRLATWLEEYSLSELWEKNVLGGRP